MLETPRLSHYRGHELRACCEWCNTSLIVMVDDAIDALGDQPAEDTRFYFADRLGCKRPFQAESHGCKMRIILSPPEPEPYLGTAMIPSVLRRWQVTKAEPHIRLCDFKEWESLFAICRCGHAHWLDHKDLRRRFGSERTLGELQRRLRCRVSSRHRQIIFGIGKEKR